MRKHLIAIAWLFASATAVWAATAHHNTAFLELLNEDPLIAGKETTVTAKLRRITDGITLTDSDLKTAHTQKFHLLVIDPTLTDYHHVHPVASSVPGTYEFNFLPKISGGYKAWADITPVDSGQQEFVPATIGDVAPAKINKTVSYESDVGEYHFELAFDEAPKRGKPSMGTIHVTDKNGKDVKYLEPVMGAFAHIVGFYDDLEHVVHIHPLGPEPAKASERGGPDIEFHLEPSQTGFIKMFAQVNIGGKELFAPFGVKVLP